MPESTTPFHALDTKVGREYTWKGEAYPSVTTILNKIPKPGLEIWKQRSIVNAAAKERVRLALMSEDEVKTYLSSITDRTRDQAGLAGTNIHKSAERLALGGILSEDEQASPRVEQFKRFLDDWQPRFIETEASVFSRTYGFAGTLDAVMEIRGRVYIVDYKSGKRIYPETALQLAAYNGADFIGRRDGTEDPLPKTSKALVLHITPDGYELQVVRIGEDKFNTFLSLLDVHNWVTRDSSYALGPKLEVS